MKILMLAGEGAIRYVRMGYANAMAHVGIECLLWHPSSGRAIFDIFHEFQPDVVMCGSWEITPALQKNLLLHPEVKVILWGGNWGDFDSQIDTKVDPVLMISDEEKELLPAIIKNNHISKICTYYHQNWANVTHNKWKELGLNPLGLPLAADLINLGIVEPLPELQCDVSFIGGYWPYKAININKFLIPLCHAKEKLKIKIFGYGGWPVAQHLGQLDSRLMPHLFASSIVNANIFEPLSGKYGFDVNERCYKILACKGFCVSEYCESAANDIFTDNEVVFAKTPQEFEDKIRYFIDNIDEREAYMQRGIHSILTKHNYFIRLKTMFDILGIGNDFNYAIDTTIKGLKHD